MEKPRRASSNAYCLPIPSLPPVTTKIIAFAVISDNSKYDDDYFND